MSFTKVKATSPFNGNSNYFHFTSVKCISPHLYIFKHPKAPKNNEKNNILDWQNHKKKSHSRIFLVDIPDRIPNVSETLDYMRQNTPNALQGEPRKNPNSKRFTIPRFGVKLHIKNGKAFVGVVNLSWSLSQKLVLSASSRGYDPKQGGPEVPYDLQRGFLGVKPLGFIVGDELLWGRQLSLLGIWVCGLGCGGAGILGFGVWGQWLFHWGFKIGEEEMKSFFGGFTQRSRERLWLGIFRVRGFME